LAPLGQFEGTAGSSAVSSPGSGQVVIRCRLLHFDCFAAGRSLSGGKLLIQSALELEFAPKVAAPLLIDTTMRALGARLAREWSFRAAQRSIGSASGRLLAFAALAGRQTGRLAAGRPNERPKEIKASPLDHYERGWDSLVPMARRPSSAERESRQTRSAVMRSRLARRPQSDGRTAAAAAAADGRQPTGKVRASALTSQFGSLSLWSSKLARD